MFPPLAHRLSRAILYFVLMWHFPPACSVPPSTATWREGRTSLEEGKGLPKEAASHWIGAEGSGWDGLLDWPWQASQAGHWVVRIIVHSLEEPGCPMLSMASVFLHLFPFLSLFWFPCFCSVGSSFSRWSVCTGAETRPQAMTGRASTEKGLLWAEVWEDWVQWVATSVFLHKMRRWRLQLGFSCPRKTRLWSEAESLPHPFSPGLPCSAGVRVVCLWALSSRAVTEGQREGQGRLPAMFHLRSSSPQPLSLAWRRIPEERVFYDWASFSYGQEGSFCNLCMKFMLFPGERRGPTEWVGGTCGKQAEGSFPAGVGRGRRGHATQLTWRGLLNQPFWEIKRSTIHTTVLEDTRERLCNWTRMIII